MSFTKEQVVLVDELDNTTGIMEKMEAHQRGLLHRAFSVLLFNDNDELLLQQRAGNKYHCAGLWTNTCCSHPYPGEDLLLAAKRRLMEEMGIGCELRKVFNFIYRASFDNGLTEHEFDHVLFGRFSGQPVINEKEVLNWKYMPFGDLQKDIAQNPQLYTPWFRIIVKKIAEGDLLQQALEG